MSPRPSVYRKIAYTFLGLTVVIVIGVLWLTSVKAEVVVHTSRQTATLDGIVEVAKQPSQGQIPGRVLRGTFEKIQEFDVQGELAQAREEVPEPEPKNEPERLPDNQVRARGKVTIVNTYSKTQPLVKTTRLLTPDNKLYRIDKTISVPPGGEVEVEAYADQTGYAFAIGPTERFTIPGLYEPLQEYIYGVSHDAFVAEPIGEGEDVPEPVVTAAPKPSGKRVTQADLDRAERTLMDVVLSRAKNDLAAEAGVTGDMETVYVVKVLDKKTNVSVGQATDSFLSSLKLEVEAVFYSKEDMQALVRSRLRERVPEGREFLPMEGSSISYSIETSDPEAETAAIRVKAEGAYRLSPSNPLLQPSVITGKKKEEARALLTSIDGVEDVEITIRPTWLGSIPSFKDKVEITIE